MNQQRARRFKTKKAALEAAEAAAKRGEPPPETEPFDSNCITPGTEFMDRLTAHLRFFIRKKIAEDPEWQRPVVILSGPDVPGEGEHKIMQYIREHGSPTDSYCIYGLDADLIMLGMVLPVDQVMIAREADEGVVLTARRRAFNRFTNADEFSVSCPGVLRRVKGFLRPLMGFSPAARVLSPEDCHPPSPNPLPGRAMRFPPLQATESSPESCRPPSLTPLLRRPMGFPPPKVTDSSPETGVDEALRIV
jgi:hypothetical protein